MFALKVNPNKETVFPSKFLSLLKLITLSASEFFLEILEVTEALIIFRSNPNLRPILDKAIESFKKGQWDSAINGFTSFLEQNMAWQLERLA